MFDLDGLTAFVTGASQGIGEEIAVVLANSGANVMLAARSDGIYDTAARIDDDRALPHETDVTDEESVEAAIEATVDEFGGLDCLVNNAGIAGPTAPVEEVTREEWDQTMAVNVTGMFLCAKHAVPHLRESDNPSIANISSIGGKRPLENRTPYSTSKMAILGLTRTLAFEVEDGIRVNTICPGPTKGPRIESVIQNQADLRDITYEEAKEVMFLEEMALGDLGEADDIANMVAFLASEMGDHITAQDINIDGGGAWY